MEPASHSNGSIVDLRWMVTMKLLKYLLIAVTLVSWVADQLLMYVPGFSDWSFLVFVGCINTLFVGALLALIGRKWNTLAIFSVAFVVILLPQPGQWLRASGFRIHASPIEKYLAQCRLVTFEEDGKKQQVGECQGIPSSDITWDTVIYDTTGQLVLPRDRRTQGWKSAMGMLSSPDVYIESEGRASHIFGDFYVIGVRIDELQGG
jgi:hypothetical protein